MNSATGAGSRGTGAQPFATQQHSKIAKSALEFRRVASAYAPERHSISLLQLGKGCDVAPASASIGRIPPVRAALR